MLSPPEEVSVSPFGLTRPYPEPSTTEDKAFLDIVQAAEVAARPDITRFRQGYAQTAANAHEIIIL